MYELTVRSKVGMHSEILSESHIEMVRDCYSVQSLCDTIKDIAQGAGWRDFSVKIVDEHLDGVPLWSG